MLMLPSGLANGAGAGAAGRGQLSSSSSVRACSCPGWRASIACGRPGSAAAAPSGSPQIVPQPQQFRRSSCLRPCRPLSPRRSAIEPRRSARARPSRQTLKMATRLAARGRARSGIEPVPVGRRGTAGTPTRAVVPRGLGPLPHRHGSGPDARGGDRPPPAALGPQTERGCAWSPAQDRGASGVEDAEQSVRRAISCAETARE
jgi:hypothetical protein